MKNTVIVLLLLVSMNCFAQIDKTIKSYPKPYYSDSLSKQFFSAPDRIKLYPYEENTTELKDSPNSKSERELTAEDYHKPIEIKSPIAAYENWDKLNTPIIKTESGFRYKELNFDDENDAFMILSPTRHIISGNSQAIIDKIVYCTTPRYPITIMRNGNFMMFAEDNFEIDLDKLEKEHYYLKSSRFYDTQVANTISEPDSTLDVLDSFVMEFCDSAQIKRPEQRLKCFIHSNANALRLFSNTWWAGYNDFEDDYVYGTAILDVIHTVGLDFVFISHEAVHAIWNQIVNPQNFFLMEGTAVYYTLFQNYSKEYINSVENIRQYFYDAVKPNLNSDLHKLITNKDDFTINPNLSYGFAGIFCDYLIKTYGLERFKEISAKYENEKSFELVYKKDLHQLIDEVKESIEKR